MLVTDRTVKNAFAVGHEVRLIVVADKVGNLFRIAEGYFICMSLVVVFGFEVYDVDVAGGRGGGRCGRGGCCLRVAN